MMDTKKVIFFDGYCGLCNGFVDFVMKYDKKGSFFFSPLQSDFAKAALPESYTKDLKTIIVSVNGDHLKKAPAVFTVLKELSFPWSLLYPLKFLPSPLLNFGYDFIATNRYRFFGKKTTCRLPTPEEKKRFLI